jgi:SAM-dependent methyltransferase
VSGDVFGDAYAAAYDALYRDKDYEAECDLLEELFGCYGPRAVESVLDLGCGTGRHAVALLRRGYEVVGVDRSAAMVAEARARAATANAAFHVGDVRDADLGRRFDAVVMLFAVLGYQTTNADALAALRTVQRHLVDGGLALFDVWYGPAVLAQRPSARERTVGALRRRSSSRLDVSRQICSVAFELHRSGGDVVRETHDMRFFFPLELELLLDAAELELLRIGSFPDFERDPDETTWSVLVAARARRALGGRAAPASPRPSGRGGMSG